jgi:hypothetical protein
LFWRRGSRRRGGCGRGAAGDEDNLPRLDETCGAVFATKTGFISVEERKWWRSSRYWWCVAVVVATTAVAEWI